MKHRAQQQRTFFAHFILERLRRRLETVYTGIWQDRQELNVSVSPPCRIQSSFAEAQNLRYRPVEPGELFARAGWNTIWFRLEPAAGASHLLWEVNGESTIFFEGEPWCGLDTAHRWTRIPEGAAELYIRCSTYETGLWMRQGEKRVPPPVDGAYRFYGAYSAVRDREQWKIYHDLLLIEEFLRHELGQLDLLSPEVGRHKLLDLLPPQLRKLLHYADIALDAYDQCDYCSCSEQLDRLLEPRSSLNGSLSLIGNSHLDLVWLWPEGATREKNIHTCSTLLRLMEEYPELSFTMSQPWLLDALKEDSPSLYRQVRSRIGEGRWELTGGMYVEPDTLLPCGEALVRACLLGQEVFQRETGALSKTLWLPDVFGYSQCVPQIAAAAGIETFYTTKLLWSSMTVFPYSSFVWQGLDGSELLCHVSQVGYESRADVDELSRCAEANKQAALFDDALLAVGFGDGGGGVTEEQCERVKRLGGFSTLPSASWRRVDDFFCRLSDVRDELPRYRGELYLEYHRGTYTTNHAIKQAYREAEQALQTVEAAAVYAGGQPDLSALWKRLVFAEFHDALPGSSIARVYEELLPQLRELRRRAEETTHELLSSGARSPVFFNPSGITGSWLLTLDPRELDSAPPAPEEETIGVPIQKLSNGRIAALVSMEGISTLKPLFVAMPDKPAEAQKSIISGGRTVAHFSPEGFLSRLIVDGDSLLLTSPARFKLYPDHPANYDAWEIDHSVKTLDAPAFNSMDLRCIDDGPLVTRLQGKQSFGGHSTLMVTYSVVKNQPYLFISVEVDWQEEHALLTYELPTGYMGLTSRFGTPFGSIDRRSAGGPAEKEAMWELPASRWLAVHDGMHRGLALLSANTYGCSVHDGTVELSLLRSPCSADEQGIKGEKLFVEKSLHSFEFAIGPYFAETDQDHLSTAQASDTLFLPPLYLSAGKASPPFKLKKAGTLVISWIKQAVTRQGYILRLHEAAGTSGEAIIELGEGPAAEALLVDLLERPRRSLEISDKRVQLRYSAYELLSLLIVKK